MTEQEIEIDDTTDTVDDVDTTDSDDSLDNLTTDDYLKEKNRRIKAEKALVDLKKKAKDLEAKPSGEYLTREQYEIESQIDKFLDKNADLAEYKDDITKYAKAIVKEKGIPLSKALEKAKVLVESDDETIANRQKASKATITGGEDGHSGTYTQEEVAKMPPEKAQALWAKARRGEIKIK